ncbi:type I secretion system permease/ATPase [Hoeflea sp.]|uniref:type I secretion system permease/ATPase n=1 Tax=Hoeflea sp. TaxID=1940281 RepID=UPI003BAFC88C
MSEFLAPVRRTFWIIAGFTVFLNALVLAVPLYMLQIYDRVLASRSLDTLVMISVLAVLAIAVFGLLEGVRGVMASRAAARFESGIAEAAMERILQRGGPASAGGEALRDISQVRAFISSRISLSLLDLPFAPMFIAMIFLIHPLLGYVTLAGAATLVALALINDRLTFGEQRKSSLQAIAGSVFSQSVMRNAEVIRAMGMFRPSIAKWTESQTISLRSQDRIETTNSSFMGMTRFVRLLLQVAILGLGAYLVLADEMTAGMIFASSIISSRAFAPIEQAIGGWSSVSRARLALRRIAVLFETTRKAPSRTKLPRPEGRIEADGVVYVAPGGGSQEPVLGGVSFKLEPGEVVVVLGPSGAGKSTLARLLVGAIDPTRGHVRLDGADINVWPESDRFAHIGYLPQQIELMPGTIAENISRFDPVRDDAKITDAAQHANVHDMIVDLPDAYETVVGPAGRQLSGGQLQRVALARALYGEPSMIVLDEPNSHLDTEGEEKLAEAIIAAKKRGTTCVLITQRPAVVQIADRIMILNHGRVEALGPRAEMLARLVPGGGNRQDPARKAQPAPAAASGSGFTATYGANRMLTMNKPNNDKS